MYINLVSDNKLSGYITVNKYKFYTITILQWQRDLHTPLIST